MHAMTRAMQQIQSAAVYQAKTARQYKRRTSLPALHSWASVDLLNCNVQQKAIIGNSQLVPTEHYRQQPVGASSTTWTAWTAYSPLPAGGPDQAH
jgi:hypothetical protein